MRLCMYIYAQRRTWKPKHDSLSMYIDDGYAKQGLYGLCVEHVCCFNVFPLLCLLSVG